MAWRPLFFFIAAAFGSSWTVGGNCSSPVLLFAGLLRMQSGLAGDFLQDRTVASYDGLSAVDPHILEQFARVK